MTACFQQVDDGNDEEDDDDGSSSSIAGLGGRCGLIMGHWARSA